MAQGRCVNIMRCSKAKNKEIQEADKSNFVCAECGKPLVEVTGGTGGNGHTTTVHGGTTGGGVNKKVLYGAGAVILAACIGGGAYFATSGGSTDKTPGGVDSTLIQKRDSIEQARKDSIEKAKQDSIEKAKKEEGKDKHPGGETTPKPKGPKHYSFATFDGTTMVFKTSHVIPGTSQVAEPGDKVTGVWDENGEVNSVRWYHADGSASETLTHE